MRCYNSGRRRPKGLGERGQMIVEYSVMFTVLVAVILFASTALVRPSLNRFFNSTANVIDVAVNIVQNGMAASPH